MPSRPKKIPENLQPFEHLIAEEENGPSAWCSVWVRTLTVTGNVTAACLAADVARPTVYIYRDRHPWFAAAWEDALERYCDRLESEADRRGFVGVEKPLLYQGKRVTEVDEETGKPKPIILKEYSDTLAIFRLKALRPEKYRERTEQNLKIRAGIGAMPPVLVSAESEDEYRKRRGLEPLPVLPAKSSSDD
jgi:hypothetical protein